MKPINGAMDNLVHRCINLGFVYHPAPDSPPANERAGDGMQTPHLNT